MIEPVRIPNTWQHRLQDVYVTTNSRRVIVVSDLIMSGGHPRVLTQNVDNGSVSLDDPTYFRLDFSYKAEKKKEREEMEKGMQEKAMKLPTEGVKKK